MRQKLVVGNWKMHGSRTQVRQLIEDVAAGTAGLNDVEIAVAPTFLHLGLAAQLAQQVGANTSSWRRRICIPRTARCFYR